MREVALDRLSLSLLAGLAFGCSSSQPHSERGGPPSGHPDAASPAPMVCNGLRESCDRRYDEVTVAATHDAFSYASGGPVMYGVPNQDRPIPDQLAYGIRALGIRPCPYFGSDPAEAARVYVTHNSDLKGALGTEPLEDVLGQVRAFLEANPNEIVTLLAESTVTPAEVAETFQLAGLVPYLYTHDKTVGWPTLRHMIASGTRLVVFNDSQDASRPTWQHYMWNFIVDTDYNITDKSQFSCKFYRGQPANDLYFINQFIYKDLGSGVLIPDKTNAGVANDETFAFERSVGCWREMNRIPNFVYVDWFGQGNVRGAVRCLNALPRTVPAADVACVDADAGAP
jgi:hypothetical protein